MRIKCISCEVLSRVVYYCAAHSPHLVDVSLMQLGLHNNPADLRTNLQQEIDQAAEQNYDAVVLAYGLCGKATAGLQAKTVPLVIPRAHDCITLFLGSRTRYQEAFQKHSGTYWYTLDYVERGNSNESKSGVVALGSGLDSNIETVYDEYVEKYGKDNADYLMEVMGAWQEHYSRAAFIDLGVGDTTQVEEKAQATAAKRGWSYDRVTGDMVLVRKLLNGDWDEDFLTLQPGGKIKMAFDDDVVTCIQARENQA